MNEARKKLIDSFRYLPVDRLQPILDAKKNGISDNLCAAAAGISLEELRYMLKLGADGHKIWYEFFQAWRRAEYINGMDVWTALKARATAGDEKALDTFLLHHDADYINHSQEPRNGKSLGSGITIQVAQFAPTSSEPRSLPAGAIDGELE